MKTPVDAFDLALGEHPDVFAGRLRDAALWCPAQDDEMSPETSPYDPHESSDAFSSRILRPTRALIDSRMTGHEPDVVATLGRRRANALNASELGAGERGPSRVGRLLVIEPSLLWRMSGESSASCGFIGWDGTPPWDTWVAWFALRSARYEARRHRVLVSWVPRAWIALLDEAIYLGEAGAFWWLGQDECDAGIREWCAHEAARVGVELV